MKIFWWLLPGLRLKRYVFEVIAGVLLLAVAGVLYTLWLTGDTSDAYSSNLAQKALPLSITALIVSIALLWFGILGLARSIIRILRATGAVSGPFKDLAIAAARRETGPKVVAFGGGTGMKSLLRGLKAHTGRISAVITMADDGGSSGRLRHEFGALPPGDIRNCLIALSNAPPVVEQLLQYRYDDDMLGGHSFGNLFITTMHRITGDFTQAVRLAGQVLSIAGEVLPSTTDKVALVAKHKDGSVTTGQSEIQNNPSPVESVELRPTPGDVHRDIAYAIREAGAIVLGPGSLYTSIIPNLLVPGMARAIRESYALKIYVCNILTQMGETDAMTAQDHVRAIEKHVGGRIFDVVLVNSVRVDIPDYRSGQSYVEYDPYELKVMGYRVVEADLIGKYLLHDEDKVARKIVELVNQKVTEETAI